MKISIDLNQIDGSYWYFVQIMCQILAFSLLLGAVPGESVFILIFLFLPETLCLKAVDIYTVK